MSFVVTTTCRGAAPWTPEMKNSQLLIRIDDQTKARWRARAEASDKPLSHWVREACERHHLTPKKAEVEGSITQMRRLANRLTATTPGHEVSAIGGELQTLIRGLLE
jgi:hypothetical protein